MEPVAKLDKKRRAGTVFTVRKRPRHDHADTAAGAADDTGTAAGAADDKDAKTSDVL